MHLIVNCLNAKSKFFEEINPYYLQTILAYVDRKFQAQNSTNCLHKHPKCTQINVLRYSKAANSTFVNSLNLYKLTCLNFRSNSEVVCVNLLKFFFNKVLT